jgi:hypothetical protein
MPSRPIPPQNANVLPQHLVASGLPDLTGNCHTAEDGRV